MGKLKTFLIKLGFLKESKIVFDKCLNCDKPLTGMQTMFCSNECGNYYRNVKTPIKQIRKENEQSNECKEVLK